MAGSPIVSPPRAAFYGRRLLVALRISRSWNYRCHGQIPAVFPDAVAPLTTLPLAWRGVTIVSIAKLLLGGAGDIKPVDPWVRYAFQRYTDSAISGRQVSSAPIATPLIKFRSDCEYKRLAMEIVHNENWNSVTSKRGKAAKWALGRMIRQAVSGE